jgi:diguanylate cyclase (GGDEF)-like protein/PAS domain S-box-containing protein
MTKRRDPSATPEGTPVIGASHSVHADWRFRAEQALRTLGRAEEHGRTDLEHVAELLHELEVHQIEIELQNEELRETTHRLETSRTRYLDLYDLAPVGYLTLTERNIIRQANLTAAAKLGIPRADLIGKPLTKFIVSEDQDAFYLQRRAVFETGRQQSCELRLLGTDGASLWMHVDAVLADDGPGGDGAYRATLTDISAHKQAEAQIQQRNEELVLLNDELAAKTAALETANATISRIAASDHLTGLANRRHFYESLEKAISMARRHGSPLGVVSLDLDGLKQVNDTAGHAAGDEVLVRFAVLLRSLCRAEDLPGRLGGDEFSLLLPGVDLDGARHLAGRVLVSVRACPPLEKRGVTVSCGIAAWAHDERADDLLRRADGGLYAAKREGGDSAAGDE